jgi:hypothetical protein
MPRLHVVVRRRCATALLVCTGVATVSRQAHAESASPLASRQTRDAELTLNVSPSLAHVYVENEGPRRYSWQCTGWCSLSLPAGKYRIRAGFEHAHLSSSSAPFDLSQNALSTATVRIHERVTLRWVVLGLLGAGVGALSTGCVMQVGRYGLEGRLRIGSPEGVLVLSGSLLSLAGMLLAATTLSAPSLEVAVKSARHP